MTTPNIYCFIPCNLDSKRLPNKPLLEKNGKTILEHTYELASQIRCLARKPIVLYSDRKVDNILKRIPIYDEQIGLCTQQFNNGTLRCAYAAGKANFDLDDDDIIVNIQVDEVDFYPESVNVCLGIFEERKYQLGSFYSRVQDDLFTSNPNRVKVILDYEQCAVFFTRSMEIPCLQEHIGIYIYTVKMLKLYKYLYNRYVWLGNMEGLEQMIFYNRPERFHMFEIPNTLTINTQEDYDEWLQR